MMMCLEDESDSEKIYLMLLNNVLINEEHSGLQFHATFKPAKTSQVYISWYYTNISVLPKDDDNIERCVISSISRQR